MLAGFEGSSSRERKDRKSEFEISEDEKKKKVGGLKKRAISASSKIRRSFSKKKSKRKIEGRSATVSIEDVRDVKEVQAVQAFRQALALDELLPARHDNYYTLLRLFVLLVASGIYRLYHVVHLFRLSVFFAHL